MPVAAGSQQAVPRSRPARPERFLAGREIELAVFSAHRPALSLAKSIIALAPTLYPAIPAARGMPMIPSNEGIFTDNEMMYIDPWTGGVRDWFNLELAVAECDDPFVLHERRLLAEARADRLARAAEEAEGLPPGSTLLLGIGDDLYNGRTRGFHWNYCATTPLKYIDMNALVTWIVASSLLFGAGGLGGERGSVLDGRSRHLHSLSGPSITSERRGLLSTKRWTLAGKGRHRLHFQHEGHLRLCDILSDGLKLILLKALERDACRPRLTLEHPVEQLRALNLSASPLTFRLRRAGGGTLTALQVLRRYQAQLVRFCNGSRWRLPSWATERILPAFEEILRAAEAHDLRLLGARLDSWMRLRYYDTALRSRLGLSLSELAPWMPVAAVIARSGMPVSEWNGPLSDIEKRLDRRPREAARKAREDNRLPASDPDTPRKLAAIRWLVSLELRLSSARQDNPLARLAHRRFIRPVFGQELNGDADRPPPDPPNRARARAELIRSLSARGTFATAGWQQVLSNEQPAGLMLHNLGNPFSPRVPAPVRPGSRAHERWLLDIPARTPRRGLRHGCARKTYAMRRLSVAARALAGLLSDRRPPGSHDTASVIIRPGRARALELAFRLRSYLRGLPSRPPFRLEATDDFDPILWIHRTSADIEQTSLRHSDGDRPGRSSFCVTHMIRRPIDDDDNAYTIAAELVAAPLARPAECAERLAWMRSTGRITRQFSPWDLVDPPGSPLEEDEREPASRLTVMQSLLLAGLLLSRRRLVAVIPGSFQPDPLIEQAAARRQRRVILLPRALFPRRELERITTVTYDRVGASDYGDPAD
jgi:hypothetical protein